MILIQINMKYETLKKYQKHIRIISDINKLHHNHIRNIRKSYVNHYKSCNRISFLVFCVSWMPYTSENCKYIQFFLQENSIWIDNFIETFVGKNPREVLTQNTDMYKAFTVLQTHALQHVISIWCTRKELEKGIHNFY